MTSSNIRSGQMFDINFKSLVSIRASRDGLDQRSRSTGQAASGSSGISRKRCQCFVISYITINRLVYY